MARDEESASRQSYALRAVDRVCDILDVLANSPSGVGLIGVADAAGFPKSSVFRYLSALEARRYVTRDAATGLYMLGVAFRPQHTRMIERLVDVARVELDRLRDVLQETANLGVLDGDQVLHLAVAESPNMMRLAARVGERGLVHSTALGKSVCTQISAERVREILKGGMPRITEHTLTDVDDYIRGLEAVRAQGYSVDDEENQSAGRCVAVPLLGVGVPAGLSISAPLAHMPRERIETIVAELRHSATAITDQLPPHT